MGGAQSQGVEEESILTEDGQTPKIYANTKLEPGQWPIVYSNSYNIGFMGLQRLHPFDSGKWGKIFTYLKGRHGLICTDVICIGCTGHCITITKVKLTNA